MIQKKTAQRNGTRPARSRNNTKRKRSDEALQASEATYRAIFNAVNEGILVLDMETGQIVDANATFCNVFGYTPEELRQRRVGDFSSGEAPYIEEGALRWIHEAAKGPPQRFEWLARSRDGRLLWIDVALKRATIAGQDCVLAIGRDITERKQAEEALRESERRYRLLAENATDVIWTADLDLNFTYISPSRQLLGQDPGQPMPQRVEEALTPASFEIAMKALAEELATESMENKDLSRSRTLELENYRSDGSTVWVEDRMTFLRDPDGRPVGILGVSRDITERKQAEETLRESEERYRLLAENVTDVIWTADMDLNYTYISPSRQLLGQAPGQPTPQRVEEALTPASLEITMKVLAEELAIESMEDKDLSRSRTLELENYRSDGSTVWVEDRMTFLRDPDGRPVGILGVTRDITERKQAEEALRESEERFRTLSEASFEAIAIHRRGTILEANQALATMFGYELPEVIGMHTLDFVAPESHDAILQSIMSKYREPFEFTGLRRDGTTFACEVCGRAIPYRGKMVTVVAVRDITDRKRAEEALQKAREELEARVERQMERGNPHGLTFRELTVLHLVAAGKADKEIATQLGITTLTASKHLANILSKMGAASRTEACVRALREGLLD